MIQLQRLGPQVTDADGFARSGIRSYHEYVVLARLPEVEGVSGRVIEALQKRVGHSPMAIEHIAEDLNLSKRTLQRRLQQQDSSFAQLRDSLRFHYAIKYLIDEHMSVDAVSTALDFSDRTSFTNAFKRWTNLSPSVFRKLFRDYA
ncbi:helix-turn-helix domain-containing protein [Gilvimarinus algae]|uniref:Helix-turn-helix domain-containing protein n=1 Tax=Gilvimarinus algae TaxID=3058037 RepID=A0ABT8TEC4_9GAMM|nr:helix-turn-helix domain-containing protein [Gilvimarinus sp. SDUM040014]MDO3382281.1 helix-turn-helix domain-containing protein [Gilvimarinus sp. SDUM040014]